MSEFQAIDLTGQAPSVICSKCATNGLEHAPSGLLAPQKLEVSYGSFPDIHERLLSARSGHS